MSTTTPPAVSTGVLQPKRDRLRIFIPIFFVFVLILGTLTFYLRGTWADSTERNPAKPADGIVTQLLKKPDGNVVVRCAGVVNAPPKAVWAVIIDYENHHKFLPYVSELKGTKQFDGRFLVEGTAHSRLWGDWPFEVLASHLENAADEKYGTHWNEEDKDLFKVSRGGWSVTPLDDTRQQTLVVVSMQIELTEYPDFLVRNVIMDRLDTIVKAMRDESLRRNSQ